MDRKREIGRYGRIVMILLAALPLVADHAPGPLGRLLRNMALAMLRPLESCVRMLALALLCTTKPSLPRPLGRQRARGRQGGSSGGRGFVLFAAGESLPLLRPAPCGVRTEWRGVVGIAGTSALGRRVRALRVALGDLPAQARRLAVALARRGVSLTGGGRRLVALKAARALRALVLPVAAHPLAPP